RYVLPQEPLPALTEVNFNAVAEKARKLIPSLASQLIDRVGNIFQLRLDVLRRVGPASTPTTKGQKTLTDLKQLGAQPNKAQSTGGSLANELEALLPARFLDT